MNKFVLIIFCIIFTLFSCNEINEYRATKVRVTTKISTSPDKSILITDTIDIVRSGKLHLEFGGLYDDKNYFVDNVVTFSILEDKIIDKVK